MTADPVPDDGPLQRGASPAQVRDRLPEPERSRFVAEYESALEDARTSLDLTALLDLIEHYRVVVMVWRDPVGFRSGVRQWAEIVTGEATPEDEPFELTRHRAGV
ncbi:DUF6247 family protein [Actinomycetospora termitidis]|uniref:DUF6247 family protein n=1 Tax=Actinomycetospora termitidis TaxID=3053470 RepID=A0ABT7MIP4_9PSEU|nr:DUF6247 family protein [Actinomycetospora sp. Odt1-22]MDL5159208.1 DUF6247 family protein [Actinomycetospora sp. Odt1-22]